jgi:replicative DNA helicase
VTVGDELAGGMHGTPPEPADLIGAVAEVPSLAHAVTYAERVAGRARVRRILAACAEVTEAAYGAEAKADPDTFADWVERTILAVTTQPEDRGAPGLLVDAAEAALDELRSRSVGEVRGVPTRLVDLDHMTGGLRAGNFAVIGARPSVGKSALCFGIAQHVAEHVGPVLFVSAEMGRVELGTRALAGGEVASDRLLSGRLDAIDFDRLEARRDQLAGLPLLIDDAPGTTLGTVRARARRQASRGGLALVVVDYLQLIGAEPGRKERRELEVAEVSRGLKALARELAIPVIAAAQLNRGVETRADKRPVLADLRDSGQLEQDADLVLLLHRPAVYDLDANPTVAELIVAKHRNGPTGSVPLVWLGQRMSFENAAMAAL